MAWRLPWGNRPEPEPTPKGDGDLTDDFDVNELLLSTPAPTRRTQREGLYQEDGPAPTPSGVGDRRKDYLAVDHAQLRRERERRERNKGLWARMRRGDISTRDLPGQAAASKAVLSLGEAALSPFKAVFENFGMLATAALVIGTVGVFGSAIIRFIQWQFGVVM